MLMLRLVQINKVQHKTGKKLLYYPDLDNQSLILDDGMPISNALNW